MGMHEFHITTYVLTCDECGTRYCDFGSFLDIPDLYQHAVNNGWQHPDDDHYYCPEHWRYTCKMCGRLFNRPSSDLEEGKRLDDTYGRTCPDCIKKRNLAEFEKLAKELEE